MKIESSSTHFVNVFGVVVFLRGLPRGRFVMGVTSSSFNDFTEFDTSTPESRSTESFLRPFCSAELSPLVYSLGNGSDAVSSITMQSELEPSCSMSKFFALPASSNPSCFAVLLLLLPFVDRS